MCGIAGILGRKLSDHEIGCLYQLLSHRGPDHFGEYQTVLNHQNVHLIHTRLSIIDPSNAAQPMISDDGRYVLIFNGEIYNFVKLRKQLDSTYRFKHNSDTEVLLAAWCRWGVDALQHLEGMFAFAMLDVTEEKLYLCRDRFGIKPLYYSLSSDNQLIFASEVRALSYLKKGKAKLNTNMLGTFLKYQTVPFENTLIEDCYSLLPGHYLEYKHGNLTTHSYYNVADVFNQGEKINDSYLEELIVDAVRKRIPTGTPTGVLLSGGIDSSIITMILRKYLNQDTFSFTIGFNNQDLSDKKYAEIVAEKFDTRHFNIGINSSVLLEEIPTALSAFDHPSADGINTWFITKAVKQQGLTVVLSGQASDEVFGGYSSFKHMDMWYMAKKLSGKKAPLLSQFLQHSGIVNERQKDFISSKNISEAFCKTRMYFSDDQIQKLTGKTYENDAYYEWGLKHGSHLLNRPFDFTSFMEITTYMSNVILRDSDQMSMAHSVEIRSPFIDHKLLEAVACYPLKSKQSFRKNKMALRSIFKDDLPPEIFNRKKEGFLMPWDHWMRNELKPFVDSSVRLAIEQEIFNPTEVIKSYDQFKSGELGWARLWLLIALTRWVDSNKITFDSFNGDWF